MSDAEHRADGVDPYFPLGNMVNADGLHDDYVDVVEHQAWAMLEHPDLDPELGIETYDDAVRFALSLAVDAVDPKDGIEPDDDLMRALKVYDAEHILDSPFIDTKKPTWPGEEEEEDEEY